MQRLLDAGCRTGSNSDLTHAALALQVIFPDLAEECEFSYSRHFLLPQEPQIHWLASQAKRPIGRMQNEVEAAPIVSTFNAVARTELHPDCPSLQARRYLAALLVEGLLQGCSPNSSEIRALGMALRSEITSAASSSNVAIKAKDSLLTFVEWLVHAAAGQGVDVLFTQSLSLEAALSLHGRDANLRSIYEQEYSRCERSEPICPRWRRLSRRRSNSP